MLDERFQSLWSDLRGKKPHMPNFLSAIRLHGIRGIDNLKIVLDYPVSVIAGANASGKSTVLFAAACAYEVPGAWRKDFVLGARRKDFVPSTLFPNYITNYRGIRNDKLTEATIDYEYVTPDGRLSMQWKRDKGWNRSFFGLKDAEQPSRAVYLRTPSDINNPSEVQGGWSFKMGAGIVLRMFKLKEEKLPAAQIKFAQEMLSFQYDEVVRIFSSSGKSLLFADNKNGASYSELHMAAGERAILRLSREIAQLQDALVLVDEVEAGLHPWMQQLLMLQLQQLALRNNLQIIVTSHSPVVLDSVPVKARIFLERNEQGNVEVRPPYRNIIQDALYGSARDSLKLLCEDLAAEGVLRGILDVLSQELDIRSESVIIGRNTGADEFPGHAAAFRKFGLVGNFIFVLDGDQRERGVDEKIRVQAGNLKFPVLFLPGDQTPEIWVWDHLNSNPEAHTKQLGTNNKNLVTLMKKQYTIYNSSSYSAQKIAKIKFENLAKALNYSVPYICRIVARHESQNRQSDIQPLVDELRNILLQWCSE